ncbi:uncharacterized protein LOC113218018 [Frankliniella occidentalis]|uniref:Uncharacterized protein LOC113218018 n=1 Tax=Frankliniella occidentalis TaxID=133901 RepID=A0A6J1TKA1_FRAOC|nr:uncharacterized protein LOC113218018 [Frankliniella occidentalis]
MSPATSPPSSVVRPGGAGGGPVAGAAGGEWHLAWTAQVYGLGTMWGVLGALCLLAAVFVDSRTRLVPRVHFTMLLALLLALAAANAVSLFYDVINHDQLLQQQERQERQHRRRQQDEQEAAAAAQGPAGDAASATRVPQLLADLTLPFLPAAFSVFFFVVLRVNHVPCGSSGVPQTPAFLVLLFLFLATTMSLEVAACAKAVAGAAGSTAWGGSGVGGGCGGGGGLRSAARGVTSTVAALLGLAYLVVYRPLRRAAAKKQAEQLRAAYTAFRRLPTPALPRVVNALLVCALLLVSLAAMATYRLMDATFINSNADWRLPPWWYMRLAEHAGSLLVGFLLLWCATRGPSRSSDERSTASRSSRGTPGALSLVSCTGRRFLFDCPSTGSEENKTSEDNTYPAVCASNHAILNYTQHTGNKLYDDSFPLANLHSGQAPINGSGDDFGSVPTMPKRTARAAGAGATKAGTLLPYNKSARRAAAAAAPGHHTLGPGGQLYDGDRDTLRRGARTTGRTRKPRHARHHQEVYSNCPQDDEYDFDQRIDLDGMADEFTVFKQYASTGSSESADNYDVPILVSAPENNKRHRRRDRGGASDGPHHGGHQHGGGRRAARQASAPAVTAPADSLSPASPSDLSDCDRLSSNRSSYDEAGPVRGGHANHHVHHNHHRGKVLLYDASEDDVTPDSAVVADITTSPRGGGSHHSPREKRVGGGKRLARRHQPVSQETPSSPELHDNVWSPQ